MYKCVVPSLPSCLSLHFAYHWQHLNNPHHTGSWDMLLNCFHLSQGTINFGRIFRFLQPENAKCQHNCSLVICPSIQVLFAFWFAVLNLAWAFSECCKLGISYYLFDLELRKDLHKHCSKSFAVIFIRTLKFFIHNKFKFINKHFKIIFSSFHNLE